MRCTPWLFTHPPFSVELVSFFSSFLPEILTLTVFPLVVSIALFPLISFG